MFFQPPAQGLQIHCVISKCFYNLRYFIHRHPRNDRDRAYIYFGFIRAYTSVLATCLIRQHPCPRTHRVRGSALGHPVISVMETVQHRHRHELAI